MKFLLLFSGVMDLKNVIEEKLLLFFFFVRIMNIFKVMGSFFSQFYCSVFKIVINILSYRKCALITIKLFKWLGLRRLEHFSCNHVFRQLFN